MNSCLHQARQEYMFYSIAAAFILNLISLLAPRIFLPLVLVALLLLYDMLASWWNWNLPKLTLLGYSPSRPAFCGMVKVSELIYGRRKIDLNLWQKHREWCVCGTEPRPCFELSTLTTCLSRGHMVVIMNTKNDQKSTRPTCFTFKVLLCCQHIEVLFWMPTPFWFSFRWWSVQVLHMAIV